jgi:hypothetical protein
MESLGLETKKGFSLKEYKATFTAKNVKKIYEAVVEIWPPSTSMETVLKPYQSEVCGLYTGNYDFDSITRGIVRHSTYANKILVVDPFIYPFRVRDEFNPILNPEQYRTQTLRNVNFLLSLWPWIESGILEVIRTPADFDARFHMESIQAERKKFADSAELKGLLESYRKDNESSIEKEMSRHALWMPAFGLKRAYEEMGLDKKGISLENFMQFIQDKRANDPDFLEEVKAGQENGQLLMFTSGANYEVAKLTAQYAGAYLVTDLEVRWKEIELDRENKSAMNDAWAPFAKAIQGTDVKYFDRIRLEDALRLRTEGRLNSLRSFMRRVWQAACDVHSFMGENARLFADELTEQVREAEEEWKDIKRDLLILSGDAAAGLITAGPLISSGHAMILAAAVAAVGIPATTTFVSRRRGFPEKFPAAFFMNLSK